MTDEEALVVLKENRPNKPSKAKGKRLQAAIDQITDSYEMEDRIDRSKAWGSLGHQLDGDKIVFYDGIFNIITETGRSKHLVICGEFDQEVSLDYFRKRESIGTTIGYA